MVYLSMAEHKANPAWNERVHLVRPREAISNNVFRILVHIDVVEDLMLYHFPREELVADGKVPWCDFSWQFGKPNGDLQEEELHPPQRHCVPDWRYPDRRPDEDDDQHIGGRRSANRGLLGRMSSWMDTRGRNKDRHEERDRGSGRYRGDSSHGRHRQGKDVSSLPYWEGMTSQEKRALIILWHAKGSDTHATKGTCSKPQRCYSP
jgi:hypothetical protein